MATTGNKVLADDFNALFTRIETVRTNHVNAGATIANTYASSRVSAGSPTQVSDVSTLNNALTNLSNSPWIDSSFTSGITIPSAGDLLQASLVNTISTKISTIEGLATGFTTSAQKGNFSDFSSAARERFFTSASSKGNFSSDFSSNNSNFTSASQQNNYTNYTATNSYFTSASSQGNFSSNHSSNHSSNFTSAASQRNFTTAASKGNFTNFTTAASKGNFTNFTTAASKGNFTSASNQTFFTSGTHRNEV